MQEKLKSKRVIEAVIIAVLLLPIILTFSTNMLFYKDSAAPEFMGKYYVYINDKENMNNIPKNTAVICEKTDTESIQVNNVILATVNPENDKAVLRVVDMDEDTYTLRSDFADESLEEPVEDSLVINKENALALCKWTSNGFGKFTAFATSNAGIVTMIVLPCTIIVLILASCILEKDTSKKDAPFENAETEKERKAREKKEKAEAKRQKLIDKKNIADYEDEILPAEPEYEEEIQEIPDTEEKSEETAPEPEKEIIKTVNDDEYAAVQKTVEAKIAAAEKISMSRFETTNLEEDNSEPAPAEEIKVTVNQPAAVEEKTKIIKAENIVEDMENTIDISAVKPAAKKEISTDVPHKPKPKSSAVRKPSATNKYSSNKYSANAAKRNTSSKSSIDDLLKTIDSEKAKHNK